LLKDKIVEAGVDKDNEITKLAQDLLDKLQEQPRSDNKLSPKISVWTQTGFSAAGRSVCGERWGNGGETAGEQ
jgi:hypothetical protein